MQRPLLTNSVLTATFGLAAEMPGRATDSLALPLQSEAVTAGNQILYPSLVEP